MFTLCVYLHFATSLCCGYQGLGVVCNKEEGFGEDDFVVEFLGEVYFCHHLTCDMVIQ